MAALRYSRTVAFTLEWYDESADLVLTFRLNYFPDGTIEMHRLNPQRAFLARTPYPQLTASELFVGSTVSIYNRQMHVVDYADGGTRDYVAPLRAKGFLLVGEEDYASGKLGGVLGALHGASFVVSNLCTVDLTDQDAARLDLPPGFGAAIEVVGPLEGGTFPDWMALAAALPGHAPDAPEAALAACEGVFGGKAAFNSTATLEGEMSLCVIKPHVIASGNAGRLLDDVAAAGFHVQAIRLVHLTPAMAEEFFDVYRGIYEDFSASFRSVVEGPTIALQVLSGPESEGRLVEAFRDACGPLDVELARTLRPKSLRGKYGVDGAALNALHCTDMPEDGELECRYFFDVLAGI